MSDRLRSMDDEALGGALSTLDLAWPPTPDLAPTVMVTTRAGRQPRIVHLPMSRSKRIMLIAAATVLLLAGAAVAAKIVIDLGTVVVTVSPTPGPLPTPTSVGSFGEPLTLEEAAALVDDDLALPTRLGRPDRIWADEMLTDSGKVVRITAAWLPGPDLPAIGGTNHGAVLMRFKRDANQASKALYGDTGVLEFETVEGIEYYWTTGTHLLELLTREGVVYMRVEGNVLLWRDGPYTMRLETSLPKTDAIRIAASAGTP